MKRIVSILMLVCVACATATAQSVPLVDSTPHATSDEVADIIAAAMFDRIIDRYQTTEAVDEAVLQMESLGFMYSVGPYCPLCLLYHNNWYEQECDTDPCAWCWWWNCDDCCELCNKYATFMNSANFCGGCEGLDDEYPLCPTEQHRNEIKHDR